MRFLKQYLETLILSIAAGLCIGIGCIVFLSIENKIIGAFLFAIGLLTILLFRFNLFTGMVGYLTKNIQNKNWKYLITLLIVFIGNFIGSSLTAILIKLTELSPDIILRCNTMTELKLNETWYSLLILGAFCGILMYIAVDTYKNRANIDNHFLCCSIIVICVTVFILAGFEHCIADIFYFILSGKIIESLLSLCIITIGNSIGANIIPIVQKITEEE